MMRKEYNLTFLMPSSFLKRLHLRLLDSLRFIVPGGLFYLILDMFFKSFGFSISAVVLLFLLSAASAWLVSGRRPLAVIPSLLFSAGSVTFLLGIGQGYLQRDFIIFSSLVFMVIMLALERFFLERAKQPQEKVRLLDTGFNLNQTVIMFSVFFLSSGAYGVYILTDMSPWQLSAVLFAGIFLASRYLIEINYLKSQELELHLDYFKNRAFLFYAFLVSALMVELVWTLTFLPVNHLTFGAIILIVFFSYWSIIKQHLRNELTRRSLISNLLFIILGAAFILLTSRLYIG